MSNPSDLLFRRYLSDVLVVEPQRSKPLIPNPSFEYHPEPISSSQRIFPSEIPSWFFDLSDGIV
jgi:hypothetical protein